MREGILLTFLAILVLGSLGTIFSSLYLSVDQNFVVYRTSYGFPFSWHGHDFGAGPATWIEMPIDVDWFSAESLLLDIAFWFAIGSILVIATLKSANLVHKRKIQKK
jgi:hypothetical protein